MLTVPQHGQFLILGNKLISMKYFITQAQNFNYIKTQIGLTPLYFVYTFFILEPNWVDDFMESIEKQIAKARHKLRQGPADTLLMQKPFTEGMYRFSMFILSYYSRVRSQLKLDYDSFMIIQTVVSHNLYHLQKEKKYGNNDLEKVWDNMMNKYDNALDYIQSNSSSTKLSISSICLVLGLPKETVRRKISKLCNKNILKQSKRHGIQLGSMYKKVFDEFVPKTTLEISKLVKTWEKNGVLKNLISFKI